MFSSIANVALGLAALSAPAAAFWRMPCYSRLLDERIDPIVDPGVVAGHVHDIAGGNGFGYTETYANARNASCSSCPITADLSNYWVPALYYQYENNGSFVKVPQSTDAGTNLGGMTVYYLQRNGDTDNPLYAFPEGLHMLSGNPYKRNYTGDEAANAINYVCLNYDAPAGYDEDFKMLPNVSCPDGLRAQVFFPSCWNGVDLDSADHTSHMAFPIGAYNDGTCPSSHPIQLISIFYEVVFNTPTFDFWEGSYGTGQPFVWSMGDPTGYGLHGDFVNGWDVDVLQNAVDNCNDDSGEMTDCEYFSFFSDTEMNSCKIPTTVNENIKGPFASLPGCNPIQTGPATATKVANCPVTSIGPAELDFTDATSLGWSYVGCAVDNSSTRDLIGYTNIYNSDTSGTDVYTCLALCESKGYEYAGLEYSYQCFCGNTLNNSPEILGYANCDTTCSGNSSQYCGGGDLLSLYKTCNGSSTCTNAESYAARGDLYGTGSKTYASIFSSGSSALMTAVAEFDKTVGATTSTSSSTGSKTSSTASKSTSKTSTTSYTSSSTSKTSAKSSSSSAKSTSSSAKSSSSSVAAVTSAADKVHAGATTKTTSSSSSKKSTTSSSEKATTSSSSKKPTSSSSSAKTVKSAVSTSRSATSVLDQALDAAKTVYVTVDHTVTKTVTTEKDMTVTKTVTVNKAKRSAHLADHKRSAQ